MSAPSKTNKPATATAADYRIPSSSGWAGAWKIAAGIAVLGLGGAAAGWSQDPTRFSFSYLFAFFFFLTIAFGAMFFVLVERLTAASWSVSTRRTAEFFMMGIPVFALLVIPVIMCRGTLYPWIRAAGGEHGIEKTANAQEPPAPPAAHDSTPNAAPQHPPTLPPGHAPMPIGVAPGAPGGRNGMPGLHAQDRGPGSHTQGAEHGNRLSPEEAADAELLEKKSAWLNERGWLIRAVVYVVAWAWLAFTFFRFSTSQDGTKDPKLTVKAQSLAPAATFIFGFTLTGAAFDWIMSLLPTWYSTIYGVTIFAGSVVAIYATLILVTLSFREAGLIKNAVNVEHYHDLGKLLFGFLIFWAYTSFAQYMLIWYAAIPDEVTFYHARWEVGPWTAISLAIVVLHFVVPFFILLSRNVKRRVWALRIGALWLILMHAVEMYWQVMPYFGGGQIAFSWIDAACLLGVGGAYLAVVFFQMTKYPLIPIGDPRLSRSLSFENA